MTEDHVERRLAAILAADVVGYSRLMEADEARTMAALKAHRRAVFDPAVAQHGGRIFKEMGDGFLVEFGSVVSATQCAMDIQLGMAARNEGLPEDNRITFRIGINLGDVIVQNADLHGDGVNVAVRLEGLAEPGGICVSANVHDQVKRRLDARFEDLGPQALKNMAEPVRVFHIRREAGQPAALALPDKPSVAVLPFTNMSGDPEQEHLSDGISEDIITALSKLSKVFVVARNSTFTYKGRAVDIRQVGREQGVRYVLEGSVRRSGGRLRITAQLSDARTGHPQWAHRYDRPVQDVFDLQDEITREVTSALQVELTEGDRARLWASGTKNLEAWEAAIQIPELLEGHRREGILPARKLAQRALQLDPGYAAAWAMLGWSYWTEAFDGWAEDVDATLALALGGLERANAIDSENPDTLSLLTFLHLSLRQHDMARVFADRAMLHGPNNSFAMAVAANAALYSSRPSDMVPLLEKAMRLCPICPAWYVADLAHAWLLMDRHADAVSAAARAVAIDPDYIYSYYALAVAQSETGNDDAAQAAARNILRIDPVWRIGGFARSQPYHDKAVLQRFTDSFRRLCLPE